MKDIIVYRPNEFSVFYGTPEVSVVVGEAPTVLFVQESLTGPVDTILYPGIDLWPGSDTYLVAV